MDEGNLADMVRDLTAKSIAHELILVDLIHDAWPLEAHRIERRESVCRALEHQIGRTDPSSHLHLHLQRVLEAVEEVYGREQPIPGG